MNILALVLFLFITSCTKSPEKEIIIKDERKNLQNKSKIEEKRDKAPKPKILSDSTSNDPLISVNGIRSLESVDSEVRRHLISVNYWFNKRFPDTEEEHIITVEFSINALGVPDQIRLLKSTITDHDFTEKVLNDIARWRFARMDDNTGLTKVIYPITLRPAKHIRL